MAAEPQDRTSRWTRVRAHVVSAWRDVHYAGRRLDELKQPRRAPRSQRPSPEPLMWTKTWTGNVRLVGTILPPVEPRRTIAEP